VSERDNLPRWTGQAGAYEVWFLTLTDPATGQGFWIRTTLHAPSSGEPSAGIWFARFDPADPSGTFGLHEISTRLHVTEGMFDISVGDLDAPGGYAHMASGLAEGVVRGGGHEVSWDLRFPADLAETYRLLPPVMYRGSLAPTKPFSPNVDTRVSGTVTVDGMPVRLERAPGQQGHLFGARHAERWAWAHCVEFIDEEAALVALTAQGRRGPLRTPYTTFVGVRWQGAWVRLAGVSRKRPFGLGEWHLDLSNRRYRLTGRVEAPPMALLRARYEDPDGTPRWCHNSEIASCRLALFEKGAGGFEEVAVLESKGTTHAEWAGLTPATAVEREFVEVDAAAPAGTST
jgi:hypothetical protein